MSNPVVRVGVACIISHPHLPKAILMGERLSSHGHGKFAVPGGHLELGKI